ncbi:hypothetical protein H310_09040 [Aphanomyces invadans]|uniref:PB1 domain-containing protein n=1 Tax=Aphanomyces invadans TaxID=157072 RepID=A0A024TXJ4_9STRA|nr:hypothetical protein H310_09040 [Aphanomyces invadans]ETV98346.1 hypothetical protein H310_09040 [Aphanomyces invadans]|eukprot:XP_008873221.1 hypothetical protein H310_09040 [Aphanomyces invadans]
MDVPTALKVGYRGEIHRIRVDLAVFGFADLQTLFAATFHLPYGSISIHYKDIAGGFVAVRSTDEFRAACQILLSQRTSLRFFSVPTTESTLHDQVVAKTIRTGAVVNASGQNAEMKQAAGPGTLQSHPAQDCMDSDGVCRMQEPRILNSTQVQPTSVTAATSQRRRSIMERPCNDTSENVRVAAAEVPKYTEGLVEKFQHLDMTPAAAPNISCLDAIPRAPSGPSKWATELELVHEIIPDADATIVVALLETSKGEIQVVMNALTS